MKFAGHRARAWPSQQRFAVEIGLHADVRCINCSFPIRNVTRYEITDQGYKCKNRSHCDRRAKLSTPPKNDPLTNLKRIVRYTAELTKAKLIRTQRARRKGRKNRFQSSLPNTIEFLCTVKGRRDPKVINPNDEFAHDLMPLPRPVMRLSQISAGAKVLFATLSSHYNERNGHCFPSQKALGRELGVSPKQVRRYLGELTSLQLVAVTPTKRHRSRSYVFLKSPLLGQS